MKSFKERVLENLRHNREEAERLRKEVLTETASHHHSWLCRLWCPQRTVDMYENHIAVYGGAEDLLIHGKPTSAIEVLTQVAEWLKKSPIKALFLPFADASTIIDSARQESLRASILELVEGLKQEMGVE